MEKDHRDISLYFCDHPVVPVIAEKHTNIYKIKYFSGDRIADKAFS